MRARPGHARRLGFRRAGSSVPHDWDGGWRRTAAPELTLSRAPLGVSDGLTFRAGLAAWQNPSFDTGLGHALRPTAPTGLVRGVTRPAAAQPTHTGGAAAAAGPAPGGVEAPQGDGNPDAGTRPARPGRRTAGHRRSGRPAAEVPSGPSPSGLLPSAPSYGPPAVREPGSGLGAEPVVARPGGNSDNSAAGRGVRAALRGPVASRPGIPRRALLVAFPVQRAAAPGTAPVVTPPTPAARRSLGRFRWYDVWWCSRAQPPTGRGPLRVRRVRLGDTGRRVRAGLRSASRPSAGSAGRTPSGPAARPAGAQSAGEADSRKHPAPRAPRRPTPPSGSGRWGLA
ncbi:hypothetical protein O1M54_29155 [Streptomyces diastatochromogenes]|nr:hypothetical protein [Streptomyces diastatochromogenes]